MTGPARRLTTEALRPTSCFRLSEESGMDSRRESALLFDRSGFTVSGLTLPLTLSPGQTASFNVDFDRWSSRRFDGNGKADNLGDS